MRWQILAAGMVPSLVGCTEFAACDLSIQPAVVVTPVHASSGAPIEADGKGLIARGTFRDSLRPHTVTVEGVPTSFAAFGRSGFYTVTLEIPGFAIWQRDHVFVDEGSCGNLTTELTSRLVPEP
jgi:hypothetical protein